MIQETEELADAITAGLSPRLLRHRADDAAILGDALMYVPHTLKAHDAAKWRECCDKLALVHGEEAKLRLIFQWVKQGHVNRAVFSELVTAR